MASSSVESTSSIVVETTTTNTTTSVRQKNVIELNDTKAGMTGLDVAALNAKINELSKGSKFYEHKLKQQNEIDRKVAEMKKKLASFPSSAVTQSEIEMNKYGELLEKSRDYSRFIVHIDMDAFYASVEMRDNPELRDKPMAVGGDSMLSTSNYVARRFGVRAAMPGFIAKKLCPQLIIVPCNFEKYRTVSAQVQNILKDYDPDFSCVSLDEAYMDITSYLESSGNEDTPEKVVEEIRSKIFEETKLTASAGLASNGFLAKICGDICKPNNQYYLTKTKDVEEKFVNALPIRKVNGIGGTMEKLLQGLEISTCEDIWKKRAIINLVFKPITAKWLIRVSKGFQDPWGIHHGDGDRKSMSFERTLDKGTKDITAMLNILQKCAEELASDLNSRQLRCKSVAVKIKTVEFVVKSRSANLFDFTSKPEDIFRASKGLLEGIAREDQGLCVRLLGIRVSKWDKRENDGPEDDNEPPCKQIKIEEAFAKVGKKVRSFDCPICSEAFATERAVQVHLDSCLQSPISSNISSTKKCSEKTMMMTITKNDTLQTSNQRLTETSQTKTFTCPICERVVKSLVENIEIASSEHVEYCISIGGQTDTNPELKTSERTWKLYSDN